MIEECKFHYGNIKKCIIEINNYCNMRCFYCVYNNYSCIEKKEYMTIKTLNKIIDFAKKEDIKKILITGGEPTLHPQFIDVCNILFDNFEDVSICSNGYILNKDIQNFFINSNFSTYTISLDGLSSICNENCNGIKNSTKKIKSLLDVLINKNKKISIHYTLNKLNYFEVDDFINWGKNIFYEIKISNIYHSKQIDSSVQEKMDYLINKYGEERNIILNNCDMKCKDLNCRMNKDIFFFNTNGKNISCYWK